MAKWFTFKNKRHIPRWLARVLAGVLRLYAWTFRVRYEDPFGIMDRMQTEPQVYAFWHNRILFAAPVIPLRCRKRATVLVSASRDGEYITTLLKSFSVETVRGTSSRGGGQALVALAHAVRSGLSPLRTVDGPRGPKYTIHPGAVALARQCQVPLVPVCINARHFWQLKSWDRMQIPWPFTLVTLTIGEPLAIEPDSPVEEGIARLAEGLQAITRD